MSTLIVKGGRRLAGHAVAPPDKSITHRALILAALGNGPCRIAPMAKGADNRSTLNALDALGVHVSYDSDSVTLLGVGSPAGFYAPAGGNLDCGNSGTTLRVMAGVLSASSLSVTLTGDASLCDRPMSRLSPLISMGAKIEGKSRGGKLYPPITVRGAGPGGLRGMRHELEVASAQVKTALLLAGLWADGPTVVVEPARSRDHTERMLRALGASVVEGADGALTLAPLLAPWHVPLIPVAPDLSSAAFLLGAALVTGSSEVDIDTAVNPTRAGVLEILEAFGAGITRVALPDVGGEPVARLRVSGLDGLHGTTIAGALTLRAIDEIPLIAALACFARGRTVISDAGELRVKESDRLKETLAVCLAFGAAIEETPDGLAIDGDPDRLHAPESVVECGHDHRIAMTAAILGLGVQGSTKVGGAEIIEVSYPSFAGELARLGAEVHEGA